MHAAWANEEAESVAEEDAWSSRGLGFLTPGRQPAQGAQLNTSNTQGGNTNNAGASPQMKENTSIGSDPPSPDSKLHSNSKSDKTTHTKKLKYLSRTPNTQADESWIHSNTSLISRDKTFHHGESQCARRWEGSQGALSRHNTTLSFHSDGKYSHKTQNGMKNYEGGKSIDGPSPPHGIMGRQKTILNNAHAHNDQQYANYVTGFSRSKTVVSIPSKGLQGKDVKV
jgi:hypothetical protein